MVWFKMGGVMNEVTKVNRVSHYLAPQAELHKFGMPSFPSRQPLFHTPYSSRPGAFITKFLILILTHIFEESTVAGSESNPFEVPGSLHP